MGSRELSPNFSLTNFDYKILAYVLTARLQPSFENVIHSSQTAYLKGKFIGTNICKVQDAITLIQDETGFGGPVLRLSKSI